MLRWKDSLNHRTTVPFHHNVIILDVFALSGSRSFKNLEYNGICCRASPKGMVISNFLKMSRKRARCHSLSFFDGTRGYGASFPVHETTSFFFSLASSLFVFLSPSFSLFFSFFSSFSFSSFTYFSPSFIFFSQLIFFFLFFFFSSH